MKRGLHVLVIDDSATVRQVFLRLLRARPEIAEVSTMSEPTNAMAKMITNWPDVIVCDIEMPKMDGLTFLKKLMSMRPTPVIICSSYVESGTHMALQALSLGAVDLIAKPRFGVGDAILTDGERIVRAVLSAATARTNAVQSAIEKEAHQSFLERDRRNQREIEASRQGRIDLIAIGASTGGTVALESILAGLEGYDLPAILIVQHMPEKFTRAFAERLDRIFSRTIREASNGDPILPNEVSIAPGGRHMRVKPDGPRFAIEVRPGPDVNYHCPSVDVMFSSVAKFYGDRALGVILTGMGNDGTSGMTEMHARGACTIAQDSVSSVVWGMPGEAVAAGCVRSIVSLSKIARTITGLCAQVSSAR